MRGAPADPPSTVDTARTCNTPRGLYTLCQMAAHLCLESKNSHSCCHFRHPSSPHSYMCLLLSFHLFMLSSIASPPSSTLKTSICIFELVSIMFVCSVQGSWASNCLCFVPLSFHTVIFVSTCVTQTRLRWRNFQREGRYFPPPFLLSHFLLATPCLKL